MTLEHVSVDMCFFGRLIDDFVARSIFVFYPLEGARVDMSVVTPLPFPRPRTLRKVRDVFASGCEVFRTGLWSGMGYIDRGCRLRDCKLSGFWPDGICLSDVAVVPGLLALLYLP